MCRVATTFLLLLSGTASAFGNSRLNGSAPALESWREGTRVLVCFATTWGIGEEWKNRQHSRTTAVFAYAKYPEYAESIANRFIESVASHLRRLGYTPVVTNGAVESLCVTSPEDVGAEVKGVLKFDVNVMITPRREFTVDMPGMRRMGPVMVMPETADQISVSVDLTHVASKQHLRFQSHIAARERAIVSSEPRWFDAGRTLELYKESEAALIEKGALEMVTSLFGKAADLSALPPAARIYVFRDARSPASVSVSGAEVILAPWQSVVVAVVGGRRNVHITGGGRQNLQLDLEPGNTYYVRSSEGFADRNRLHSVTSEMAQQKMGKILLFPLCLVR